MYSNQQNYAELGKKWMEDDYEARCIWYFHPLELVECISLHKDCMWFEMKLWLFFTMDEKVLIIAQEMD